MLKANQVVANARAAFQSGITKPIEWRVQQLRSLNKMLTDHEEDFVKAVYADLRKNKHETMVMEVIPCRNEAINALKNIYSWAKSTYATKNMLQMLDTMYLQKEPYGVVLILGAWNYPVQLILMPVIAAIAAGNCVVIKPSELSPHTAKLISHLLPKFLDKNCFPVYNGGIPETTKLLEEKFDYILYTGSCHVGKIIMAAAAKHLTPVTLELGGKSPVYVDNNIHANIVAKRVIWGKLCNAGQTCIAPDYILCHKDVQEQLIEEMKRVLEEMLGDDPLKSKDYARIVNDRHFERISKIIEDMPQEKLVVGGDRDAESKYISPTIYKDVTFDDVVMQQELFGPILPIISVSSHKEAIRIINQNEKPLSLYVFSNTNEVVSEILEETSSGGVCVNDTIMQCASHNLPFGGVGNSGFGHYHGKWGFDLFTHEKSVCWRKQNMESLLSSRYMPYTKQKLNILTTLTQESEGRFCIIM